MTDLDAHVDEDAYRVTRTVRIAAPRSVVWDALTQPAQIGQWFGQRASFPDGVHAGAEGVFSWDEYGDFPVRIVRHDPMDVFAFTWGTGEQPLREDNATTARFDLHEEDGTTVLTVVETGFESLAGGAAAQRAAMTDNATGWTEELDELVEYLGELISGRRSALDPEAGTIVRSVRVHASQELVWDTLTSPERIEQWWGHPVAFDGEPRTGTRGTFEYVGHGLMPIRIDRWEPPRRWSLLWGYPGQRSPGEDASLVEFTVVGLSPSATLVTVVESGFTHLGPTERRAAIDDNGEGWNIVLDSFTRHIAQRSAT